MDRTLRLSAEQKCDIALREIEEYREELEKLHEESERIMDNFKVCSSIASFVIISHKLCFQNKKICYN